jgi:hypothetical protein
MEQKNIDKWPQLPLEAWEDTKITLHLWLQIIGKIKLDIMPHRNHWWNTTIHVSTNGLTSGLMPDKKGIFQFDFDFLRHVFEIQTSWGGTKSFDLVDGLTVAGFHHRVFEALDELDIKARIIPVPYDHPCEEPFDVCETYSHYDKEYVERFWKILVNVDKVFKAFSGQFTGKVSPSHIYWHHMDLAVTRFSGRKGPELPETSTIADKEAYSHEVISAGFWAGDEQVRGAAFYSYTYPSPEGIENEPLLPASAQWIDSNGSPMAMLMYDDLIKGDNPEKDLMGFLESTYSAGAKLAKWPDLTV